MKVIGVVPEKYGVTDYICQLSHTEIEKFLNLYYGKDRLTALKVGDEVDLSKGYDFYNDSMNAMKKTDEFIQANKHIIETIMTGIKTIANNAD